MTPTDKIIEARPPDVTDPPADALEEAIAVAIYHSRGYCSSPEARSINARGEPYGAWAQAVKDARAVRATLAADKAAGFWLAPMEATEEMWDGPARDIMFWLRMDQPTPRKLFDHLGLLGKEIPDWMHKETELKALDHVVSKGTCCVLIYNAMRDAALGGTNA